LEGDGYYLNRNPYCEPQLGKRNLYRTTGGQSIGNETHARLWVLNLSDGQNSLLDIAERAGIPFAAVRDAADVLTESGLLVEVEIPDSKKWMNA
jgi:aminopeptidase-like protein